MGWLLVIWWYVAEKRLPTPAPGRPGARVIKKLIHGHMSVSSILCYKHNIFP